MPVSFPWRAARAAALALPALAAAAPATWRLTPIGAAPWYGSGCEALDSRGRAVGWASLASDEFGQAAFLYDGQVHTLGITGGQDGASAADIGEDGTVVGERVTDRTFGFHEPVAWRRGKLRTLPPLSAHGTNGTATAVNAAGDIVGSSDTGQGGAHAVRWRGQAVQDLAPASVSSAAVAINAAGTIVGNADHAMVTFTDAGPVPLAGLEGRAGEVAGLDAAGDVLVNLWEATGTVRHAHVWSQGRVTPLGEPEGYESVAQGMNDRGVVVGYVHFQATFSAVAWHDGRMVVLDDALDPVTGAGWRITGAAAVNDAGQVCATALDLHERRQQAVLLTPMD